MSVATGLYNQYLACSFDKSLFMLGCCVESCLGELTPRHLMIFFKPEGMTEYLEITDSRLMQPNHQSF